MKICKLMLFAVFASVILPCMARPTLRPDAQRAAGLTPKASVDRHKVTTIAPGGEWKSIGQGMYQDDLLTIFSDFSGMGPWAVEIEENVETPHWYRFIPYCSGSYVADYLGQADTQYMYINATDPDSVYSFPFSAYDTWNFYPLLEEIFSGMESVFGKRTDDGIEFPQYSFIFEYAEEDGAYNYYYAAQNGNMKLTFPEGYGQEEQPEPVTGSEIKILASNLNGDETDAVGSTTIDGCTITLDTGKGVTNPKVWGTGEVRMYANNTISIIGPAPMVKIVFEVPANMTNMKNRYTNLLPDIGEMAPAQAPLDTVAIWVGNSQAVTFTVDGLANLGSDSTKPGQFFFNSITIYFENEVVDDRVFQEADLAALQAAYELCDGPSWSKKWDFDAKSFPGVTFDAEGYVNSINLENSNATGSFPDMLLAMPRIKGINLAHNNLTGNINTGTEKLSESLTTVNVSYNKLSGNIGAFVERCPNLTTLEASYNGFGECLPIIPPSVSSWNLSSQTLQDTIDVHISTDINKLLAHMPQIASYPQLSYDRYTYVDYYFYTDYYDANVIVEYYNNTYQLFIGKYKGRNGVNGYFGFNYDKISVTAPIRLYFTEGDVNFDGIFDVADLQNIVSYIVNGTYSNVFNFYGADQYSDDKINVQDIVVMVNKLLEEPEESEAARVRAYTQSETSARMYVDSQGRIILENDSPVAAFSFTAKGAGSIAWSLPEGMFATRTAETATGVRAVAYIPEGEGSLAPGRHILGTASGAHTLSGISLASPEGESLPCGREGGITTGLETTEQSSLDITQQGSNLVVSCPATDGTVTITVCDLAGRTVATAVADNAAAGVTVTINPEGRGAFIVSVSSSSYNITEKIFVR